MPTPEGSLDSRFDTFAYETHKLTIAHFDRLLLLNGGGLSLIITICGSALLPSQHPLIIRPGLTFLSLVGCSLLLASVFCCLLHNYLKLPGLGSTVAVLLNQADAKNTRRMIRLSKACVVLGIAALITTVVGYGTLVCVLGSLLVAAH